MKHRLAISAAFAAAVLSLAACAPSQDLTASPSASADATITAVEPSAALEAMSWIDNGDDAAPGLEATTPVDFTATGALLVGDGDGAALEDGQMLALSYVVFSGTDGSTVYSTYDADAPEQVQLLEAQIDPVLWTAFSGAHVGARVLYAVPGSGSDAAIMAVTVSSVSEVLSRAEGTAVDAVDGLPVVTLAEDGTPSTTYPTTDLPDGLVSQNLIDGAGAVVEDGQSVTVHYTGWLWNGDQFDSSWDRGAPSTFTLTAGSLIDGWVDGLVGKTVGSQVLLVIPPELGYGDDGSGDTIPGGSTLVFVVDILAAS